jgi:hypothetical protein
MKLSNLTYAAIISSFIFVSCNNAPKENKTDSTEITSEEHEHGSDEALTLNNGEKWKVNAEMMVHVKSIETDLNSFEAKSTDDYAALAKKIETNIQLLTSSCTMKGPAHDELYKWLLPFIDLSDAFSKSKTMEDYATNFQKIKTSFSKFNTYFE